MKAILGFAAIGLVAASLFRPTLTEAAEIKLLCAVAMKPALDELAPGFERSTNHKVIITYEAIQTRAAGSPRSSSTLLTQSGSRTPDFAVTHNTGFL